MGDVTELKAVIVPVPTAHNGSRRLEYLGEVPRLGVGFHGRSVDEAISMAAEMVKVYVEACFDDSPQLSKGAASLEHRLLSANGSAISHGSVEVVCGKWPDYISSNRVRITFYEFKQQIMQHMPKL